MLEKLIKLLGEENVKKLDDGITDIILDQIRADFEESTEWIINPDDISEFAEQCKEKALKNIEDEMIKKMEETMRKIISPRREKMDDDRNIC